jgi:hypothetical protein
LCELIKSNANLESIKQLIIHKGVINHKLIQLLAKLPNLKSLIIREVCFSDEGFNWDNVDISNIKEFVLERGIFLNASQELVNLLNKAENLRSLALAHNQNLHILNWNTVKFKHLEKLDISDSTLNAEIIVQIINNNKSIRKVAIDYTSKPDYKTLAILYSKLPDGVVEHNLQGYHKKIQKKVNYSLLANFVLAFNKKYFFSTAIQERDFKDLYHFLMLGISGIPSDLLYKYFTDIIFHDCQDDHQLNTYEMRDYIHNLWNTKIVPYITSQEVIFNIFINHLAASLNKDNKLKDFLRNNRWLNTSTKRSFEERCHIIFDEHSDILSSSKTARADCYKRAREIDFSQFNKCLYSVVFLDKLLEQVILPIEPLNYEHKIINKPKPIM